MKGYGGRILLVDCATGASRIEPLGETTARALLGGNGLAASVQTLQSNIAACPRPDMV